MCRLFAAIGRRGKRRSRKVEKSKFYRNNNYINSRTQTRPESGMNPLPPRHNSLLDNHKSKRKRVIQEGIMTRRKGIHTGFWPGLSPGINIIIIPIKLGLFDFSTSSFSSSSYGSKLATHLSLSVIEEEKLGVSL